MVFKRLASIPLAVMLISAAPIKDTDASKMLAKLALLTGKWQGSLTWTGARQGTDKIEADYQVSRFGGSVREDWIIDGKPYMTSVYHLDGADLRVTHFCVESQPRLIADHINLTSTSAHFKLVDVTNAGPTAGFVDELSIANPDPNRLEVKFVFHGNGPRSVETMDVHRVA